MMRLTLTLAFWISCVSLAAASLAPHKQSPAFGNKAPQARAAKLLAEALEQTATREARSEYVLTDETETLLNGKPCKYTEVPANAIILKMEVAADKKTVVRIYFRSGK